MMRGPFALLTANCYCYYYLECNILSFISLDSQRQMLFGSINHIKFDEESE